MHEGLDIVSDTKEMISEPLHAGDPFEPLDEVKRVEKDIERNTENVSETSIVEPKSTDTIADKKNELVSKMTSKSEEPRLVWPLQIVFSLYIFLTVLM